MSDQRYMVAPARSNHHRAAKPALKAFTLIELLTVIAIIAVLATLLMSAVSSAKKKSRQAYCTANLHQISLAITMYMDDHEHRPPDLGTLVAAKYLPNPKALLCPEDKLGNWGGLVQSGLGGGLFSMPSFSASISDPTSAPPPPPLPFSYLHPLGWDDDAWKRLMDEGFAAGFTACELHGIGRQDADRPDLHNFQGLILRAQRDGAVVRRQNYWDVPAVILAPDNSTSAVSFSSTSANSVSLSSYPWALFMDVSTNQSNSVP